MPPAARKLDAGGTDAVAVTTPVAAGLPERLPAAGGMVSAGRPGWLGDCDPAAVASAVCGVTALVPVVSQVLGLMLGVLGLIRIRAARQRGQARRGAGWAWVGIGSSGLMLLVWGFVIGVLMAVGGTFVRIAGALPAGN